LPVARGVTLVAAAQAPIQGTATLADGRPLVGATVVAHAAASLAANPATADARLWPRPVSTVTDSTGAFAMLADPGTYDLIVRPLDGTGFPWVTTSLGAVAAQPPPPALSIQVPAPILVDMTLQDQGGNALVGAVVRAYGATPTTTQIQLGTWLTDANGHFSMFVVPP
jgi:hypothetical protein